MCIQLKNNHMVKCKGATHVIVITNIKHLALSALLIFVHSCFYFHLSIFNSIFQPQPVNCATHNTLYFIVFFIKFSYPALRRE